MFIFIGRIRPGLGIMEVNRVKFDFDLTSNPVFVCCPIRRNNASSGSPRGSTITVNVSKKLALKQTDWIYVVALRVWLRVVVFWGFGRCPGAHGGGIPAWRIMGLISVHCSSSGSHSTRCWFIPREGRNEVSQVIFIHA